MMLGGGDACVARRPHHTRIVPMATTGDASVPTPHPPNPRPYRMEIRMREDERATASVPTILQPAAWLLAKAVVRARKATARVLPRPGVSLARKATARVPTQPPHPPP